MKKLKLEDIGDNPRDRDTSAEKWSTRGKECAWVYYSVYFPATDLLRCPCYNTFYFTDSPASFKAISVQRHKNSESSPGLHPQVSCQSEIGTRLLSCSRCRRGISVSLPFPRCLAHNNNLNTTWLFALCVKQTRQIRLSKRWRESEI